MAKVIGICNQKGGVGKTTTVFSMGRALVDKGFKVLLIDIDDSGNPTLSKISGVEDEKNLTDLLLLTAMGRDIEEELKVVIKKHKEGMDIIPTDNKLNGVTTYLASQQENDISRLALKTVINKLKDKYDYILLDAAPTINIMSVNLMTAAQEIIIVTQPQGASAEGIVELIKNVSSVKNTTNPQIVIRGLLITMLDRRTNYNTEMADILTKRYTDLGMKVFNTKIPRAVSVESCVEAHESLLEYDPMSKPAVAYRKFVEEYLQEA